jgi:hypothetical protein
MGMEGSGVKMFMLMEYGGERMEEVLLMEDQRVRVRWIGFQVDLVACWTQVTD